MKSLFNQKDVSEILDRLNKLNPNSERQWGKMNVAQMQAHCSAVLDIAIGVSMPKREWLGLLMGRFVKHTYYNDEAWRHGLPTNPTTTITDQRDFETEKIKLRQQVIKFQFNGPEKCTIYPHPFLGKLSPEQWGMGMYKHLDHHLRQFDV